MAVDGLAPALRVLIVDDEPLARARLRQLLDDMLAPPARVVGEAGQSAEALGLLERSPADVVLLDVQMPGTDGLKLAARLRDAAARPAVIFVTAHPGHALQAFDVEAVDYLTKPVRRLRLQEALARAAHWLGRQPASAPSAVAVPGGGHDGAALLVNEPGGGLRRIPVGEVLYFKAEGKAVILRTAACSYQMDDSLNDLGARLGARFLRVHRNALVAVAVLDALEPPVAGALDAAGGWVVRLRPTGECVAVSRRQLTAVREALARGVL